MSTVPNAFAQTSWFMVLFEAVVAVVTERLVGIKISSRCPACTCSIIDLRSDSHICHYLKRNVDIA